MIQLNTYPIYRTYYVNNETIYDISYDTQPVTDTHAIVYGKNSSYPYIWIRDKRGQGSETYYYLDSLITDGDKLKKNAQEETENATAFSKVCHEISGEPEKTPFDYFRYLCERQIAAVITDTKSNGYKYYYDPENGINRLSFLGVPEYMFLQNYDAIINGSGFRISDGHEAKLVHKTDGLLIDFTEAKYNTLLNEEILRRAKDAANKVANEYGKKVKTLTLEAL